jgi:hypothetical protein
MPSSRTVVISDGNLGVAGWRELHRLARLRNRKPGAQALAMLRYAVAQSLAGRDVELSNRLNELLDIDEQSAA